MIKHSKASSEVNLAPNINPELDSLLQLRIKAHCQCSWADLELILVFRCQAERENIDEEWTYATSPKTNLLPILGDVGWGLKLKYW